MKKEEKNYGLLKVILLFVVVAILLSWLIPYGQFSGSDFMSEGALARIGLNNLSELIYYAFQFALDKIVILLVIAGFYGVLVKTKAYDNITSSIAKKFSNKKLAVVIISVVIAVMTSLFTQTFAILVFVPFIISIMSKMKLDKMTIMATVFGSMLVGTIGATYGTEGLMLVAKGNYFTADGFDPNNSVLIRAGILIIGLVLFNFFNISHMSKKDKDNESIEMIPIEEVDDKKKSKAPIIIIGGLLLIIVILGFVKWNSFNVTIFDNFHKLITEDIKIGQDFYIFQSLLGASFAAFGNWDVFTISSILFIFTIIIGLCYRFKFNEFVDSYIDGCKKVIKPCMFLMGAYLVMGVVYMTPYLPTISNKILGLTDGFNIATSSLTLLLNNIFCPNLDFVGYSGILSHLASEYPTYMNALYVMISSLTGLVTVFAPTSLMLVVGLSALDVNYKDWFKYIWKFLLGISIYLIVIFILMTMI